MESCLTLYNPCMITLNLGFNVLALRPTYFLATRGDIFSAINDIELNLQGNLNDDISIDRMQ